MSNTWGTNIKLAIFGESHGAAVGIMLDGLSAGFRIDFEMIENEMKRRAPGGNEFSTPRKEVDEAEILSGLFNGRTTGAPLCAVIRNENTKSGDYEQNIFRPSHADFTAFYKYKGFADFRGGGHFSGRLTAPLVFAGAIAKQILLEKGIKIGARITSIHNVCDSDGDINQITEISKKAFPTYSDELGNKMKEKILQAKNAGDSVGGIIECAAIGLEVGMGEPFFNGIESEISHIMFSIPAVKGIEFGAGFDITSMTGSEANDQMHMKNDDICFKTNNNGGINGGITNGQPIVFRVAIKPTPTIKKAQTTVDINKRETITAEFGGRHDPCVVLRAVPVVEACLALCLLNNKN